MKPAYWHSMVCVIGVGIGFADTVLDVTAAPDMALNIRYPGTDRAGVTKPLVAGVTTNGVTYDVKATGSGGLIMMLINAI